MPTDGLHSLQRDLTTGVNSPTNYAGQTGSIDLSEPETVPAIDRYGLITIVTAIVVAAGALFRRRRLEHRYTW